MIRAHLWWLYLLAGLLGIAAYFTVAGTGTVQSLAYDALGTSAVVAVLVGLRLYQPERKLPWLLIALGQASFVIGDLVLAWYATNGETPFPSLGDAFYLAGYPLMASGLLFLIRRRIGGGDRAGILDAAILTVSAGVLSWTFIIQPQLVGSDLDLVQLSLTLAYPTMDLLLIGVAVGLLTTPGARTRSFALLVTSLALLLVTDQVYAVQSLNGVYVSGSLLDVGWLLAYLTFGAAALHPSMRTLTQPQPVTFTWLGPIRLGFLAAAMLTGPFVMLYASADPAPGAWVVAVGSGALSILVLVRLAILVRALAADVAQRSILEGQLSDLANHDPLTGLANRRLFIDRLETALAGRDDTGQPSVLYIDLDRFKEVNDDFGHGAGDDVLRVAAARISAALRPDDTAARLGGDEFGVLLEAGGPTDLATNVMTRIRDVLARPFTVAGHEVHVGASVGMAVADTRTASADDLLRAADTAMYVVKADAVVPAPVAPGPTMSRDAA